MPCASETVARAIEHYQAGRVEEAIQCCREVLRWDPGLPEVHQSLGALLVELGRLEEAAAAYRELARLLPGHVEAYNKLGEVLGEAGRFQEAAAAFERALVLEPDSCRALGNLGAMLEQQGRFREALDCYRRALASEPNSAPVLNNLGTLLYQAGSLEEALAAYRSALEARPDFSVAGSNLLCCLNYIEGLDPEAVFAEHRRWAARHAAAVAGAAGRHSRERGVGRPLRVGYVSPDFRVHSVPWFFEPVLAGHDRDAFEIYCYSNVAQPDAVTERLRALCPRWRDIRRLPDERAAALIEGDQIDILVDLAGHTSHNRLLVFARKPAPIQVTWLGYPNTTGVAAIDYRLTDAWADPPGATDRLHTEELVRLPGCFLCYQPPPDAPAVSELPADRNGAVTFGSFNNVSKATAATVAAWSAVLQAGPGARLILKSGALAVDGVRERLKELFRQNGVAEERVEMRGGAPSHRSHLEMYHRVDIALDTFPYHGTTTTCEALWMGVPVVVLAGSTHASRVGVSLLASAGLPELIAETRQDYIRLAVELAGDRERLRGLRARLRDQVARSPLVDARGFTRRLEEAYQWMWRRRAEQQHAEHD